MNTRYYAALVLIVIFGFILRGHEYEKAPRWNESLDEIHYAWTGMTWITKGVPTSWSWLSSYPQSETVNLWNTEFRLVSPMLEKPPLYSLLSGINVLVFGQDEFHEVKIATIRLLPILLSIFTIFLTGLLGAKVFSPLIGLLAALLYAVTPPIVLANRLSVTENLLIPIFLGIQLLFIKFPLLDKDRERMRFSLFIGFLAGLAALTKQSGLSAVIAMGGLFYYLKKWKYLIVACGIAFIIFSIHPIIGFSYDSQLFSNIQTELRRVGLQGGLPQLVQTIVSRPLITTEKLFPDGVMLLGYFLLFTSPWIITSSWSKAIGSQKDSIGPMSHQTSRMTIFLSVPFAYLMYMMIIITGAEPIGSGQGYWGWYAFPFFPYMMILVAVIFKNVWEEFNVGKGLIIGGIIGSSTVRYLLLFFPREWHHRWQYGMMGIFFLILVSSLQKPEYRKRILIVFFIFLIGISVYTSINIAKIY